jgi:hypothetical protein
MNEDAPIMTVIHPVTADSTPTQEVLPITPPPLPSILPHPVTAEPGLLEQVVKALGAVKDAASEEAASARRWFSRRTRVTYPMGDMGPAVEETYEYDPVADPATAVPVNSSMVVSSSTKVAPAPPKVTASPRGANVNWGLVRGFVFP